VRTGKHDPQDLNLFRYAGGDPINRADPSGLTYSDTEFDICYYGDDDDDDDDDDCVGTEGFSYMTGAACPVDDGSSPPRPLPVQCDVQLWADSAVSPQDPIKHTFLELTYYNPNTGADSVTTLEAGPVPKSAGPDPFILNDWMNKFSSPGPSGGSELFDFASEYSSAALCGEAALITYAFNNTYKDNTVSYNALLGPNSNTFARWLLGQGWKMTIPSDLSLELLVVAWGWYAAMPPNP
jgi:hypothetical protein